MKCVCGNVKRGSELVVEGRKEGSEEEGDSSLIYSQRRKEITQ